ncbi:MAG: ATP phosphoribosyltransferase regulatory subunit [Paracoccaceae bacterium]
MTEKSFFVNELVSLKNELERLVNLFEKMGSLYVEIPTLLQSDLLLDLYGEELNSRTYVLNDPVKGNLMLRPDFTVPIVQMYIKSNEEKAQYCYSGKVWRKQEHLSSRPSEYLQVGIECFGGCNFAKEDAKLFSIIRKAVGLVHLKIVTGDLGVLRSAINGLEINSRCKKALLRQLWRPKRFLQVLKYFSNSSSYLNNDKKQIIDLLNSGKLIKKLNNYDPIIGLRTKKDIIDRVSELSSDISSNQLKNTDVRLLENLLKISCSLSEAPKIIKNLTYSHEYLKKSAILLENRSEFLSELDIDVKKIDFEVSFGRTSMEYYDGFVFEMGSKNHTNSIPFAQGGRYNELTRILSQLEGCEKSPSAVGGIIRPEILHDFKLSEGII